MNNSLTSIRLLLICGVLICSCTTKPDSATKVKAEDSLTRLLPGLDVKVTRRAAAKAPYPVLYFDYSSRAAKWPYGTGFAVISHDSTNVLWIHLHDGDYPVQEVFWADFDHDGKDDILFHAGYEEVAQSFVYLNRVASDYFAISNFTLGFESREQYASTLDFDHDGFPELLVSKGDEYGGDDPCLQALSTDTTIRKAEKREYARLVGRFDSFNVDYRRGFLDLGDSIQIARLYGEQFWVTDQFRDHLQWRLALARRLADTAPKKCVDRYNQLIKYLERVKT